MDLDRDLAVQVGVTVAVVGVFVLGLGLLSGVYGNSVPVENERLNGTVDGQYDEAFADGSVTLQFEGTYSNGFEAMLDGTVTGTAENGTLASGEFEGSIEGAIDGNVTGTITNLTLDREQFSLEGEFEGTANGTTATELTDTGGLVLVGLIATFIVAMPAFGYLIRRLKTDEE